ncbi:endoglucanase [Elysia marginata]|uniref:Endoglucanase n=1 Tax=Elysia marginata TaxID=1093978 RepID=A0AAV4FAZ2_9GAST|nr:endoglucanase [Elysia marginata]
MLCRVLFGASVLLLIATRSAEAAKDYGAALGKSILFYDAQRSGKLPGNNPIPWRGDSALSDCVPGGWYDAGDHIKFGLPMASSTSLLAWSLNRFKAGYQQAGQLNQMYDMLRWPLKYFLKAWDPSQRVLTAQVGDGELDHAFWGRAEDMSMSRPCKKISTNNKGSDIAGATAAALAAGSVAFKDKGDNQFATRLLQGAESLYLFAKTNRGVFSGSAGYYGSSGDKDEMCEAAVWLYRATGNNDYLNDAKGFAETTTAWALSWDDKRVVCQELLYEETFDSVYKNAVIAFFNGWLPGSPTMIYTPCGLAWRDKWGANRYAGNAAFMALLAAEAGIESYTYRKWAAEQINYLLGDNNHNGGCFSFEIGYGNNYPKQPHHRGASCPNRPSSCTYAQYGLDVPSPQILNGALVGGPDSYDNFKDKRSDYIQSEVALDYNAGFQGALAGLNYLLAIGQMPATNNRCPCNQ